MKLFESFQKNLPPALQFWLQPVLLMLLISLGLHGLLLGLPLRTEPKPEEEPEPEPTETVEITSLIAEPSPQSSPQASPSPAPSTPPPQPTPPQLQTPPPPRPRRQPPIVQTPRAERTPEPTPEVQQQPSPSPQPSPQQPSPQPSAQPSPTPSPDNSAATAETGNNLIEELRKRVIGALAAPGINSPEALKNALDDVSPERVAEDKRSSFFEESGRLKDGAIARLAIPQKTPGTAYDDYIEPILKDQLRFQIDWEGRFAYGDSDLYKAWNDNGIEFYISLVPYGKPASQTLVVIWAKDPREL